MFDFSWSEMALVALVGLLVIGPKELPALIKNVKAVISKVKSIGSDFADQIMDNSQMTDLKDEAKKLNDDMKTIIDLDGNEQQTYDISEFLDKDKK